MINWKSLEQDDSVVRAEIPSKEDEPQLHADVLKYMIHGPCGRLNQTSPCIKNGQCKKNFPKEFSPETREGDDLYPLYWRRFKESAPLNENVTIDNRWVNILQPLATTKVWLSYQCWSLQ